MDEIVEVTECGWFLVNQYLDAGYHLLRADVITREVPSKGRPMQWHNARMFSYVVSRTAAIEHFEPQKRQRDEEGAGG